MKIEYEHFFDYKKFNIREVLKKLSEGEIIGLRKSGSDDIREEEKIGLGYANKNDLSQEKIINYCDKRTNDFDGTQIIGIDFDKLENYDYRIIHRDFHNLDMMFRKYGYILLSYAESYVTFELQHVKDVKIDINFHEIHVESLEKTKNGIEIIYEDNNYRKEYPVLIDLLKELDDIWEETNGDFSIFG